MNNLKDIFGAIEFTLFILSTSFCVILALYGLGALLIYLVAWITGVPVP